MSQMTRAVTDQSFQAEVLKSPKPVLVDYWAEWCGPCRMIGPILEASAAQYAGRLTIAKLNVDDSPATAARYSVRSIPTLMLFKDGRPVATQVGSLSKAHLHAFLDAHVRAVADAPGRPPVPSPA